MKQHHLLIIFILFISACHEETNDGRELRVTQSSGSISIQNQTKSITYYMLVDSDLASVINWAPTLDEKQSIPSKASVLIKLDSISGYSNTSNALSLSY